ncbi:AAA family ATPase [Micromonospora sp. NPDC093277]|uniref:ParA family protein n=2 Tax=Micromonospora TaxID=1873 RepID=UPI00380947F6
MHDDGRYDDPRVTGPAGQPSATDPVSRETDYRGWPLGDDSRGPATGPAGADPSAPRDVPVAGGVRPTSSGPANVPPAREPHDPTGGPANAASTRPGYARGNAALPGRYEPQPPGAALPQQSGPSPAPDEAAGVAAPSSDTPPATGHAAEPPASTYVSRETPTREEDDPPLAMEAMRAVQILNPSGEVIMPRPPRTRVMCVANQKGGVGKTTTTVNLAVSLALHGNRVLVVDLDPQGNASTGLNVPHHTGVPDVYDCLIDSVPLEEVAQAVEGIPNLWCVPATIDLAGAEIELVSVVARESRLARAISAYPGHFDYVFIDCPPSLGLLTVNALVAAQEVLIPIQCEYYALEGLNQLINNINLVRQHLNPRLEVSTILLTMYDRRTRLADAVEQDVRNHFGDKVLQAVIPRNVRVSEAPSYGQSVMTYDPGSRGATSYFEAAQEIAERGVKEPVSRNA